MTEQQVVGIATVLNKHGVKYVLIGGFAAQLQGVPVPPTRDADSTPAADLENLAKLAKALTEIHARWRVLGGPPEGVEATLDARWFVKAPIATFVTDHGPFDVSLRPDGTEGYEDLVRNAVTVYLGDVTVQLASVEDIVRSKAAAGRLKDREALPIYRRFLRKNRT